MDLARLMNANTSMESEADKRRECLHVLDEGHHGRWDEFVSAQKMGTIFHTAWWYRAWGIEPVVQACIDGQGRIQAGMCYSVGRRFLSRAVVRPPLTPCNGPVYCPASGAGRHKQNSHAKKMTLMAIHALPRIGVYDFILHPDQCDVMPFLWNGFDSHVAYTYVIPCSERETWQQQASKTQRWQIRKAAKDAAEQGMKIETDAPLDAVLPLLDETADDRHFSLAKCGGKWAAWWQEVHAHGAGRTYLLRDGQGQPAAATIMVWDNRRTYYLAGGIRSDLRKGSIANVLLVHRMICDAHEQGLDFDFEGSVLPGVERFFRSFGGELRPRYRLVKLPSLPAYLMWVGHRYWTRHRHRTWIWHE
jgi:hypothetical protein